jgi:ferritin-like metal-binding protein YciE
MLPLPALHSPLKCNIFSQASLDRVEGCFFAETIPDVLFKLEFLMKITTLEEVLTDELKDIYSAENQLIKALPKMARAAESNDLRQAFEKHLEQTRLHAQRIEEICGDLKVKPGGKKCVGMEGLIEEGKEVLQSDGEPEPLQAALIGAAQRVEHYEIAAYGTARAHAKQLGYMKAVDLLGQTLEEEKEADELLTKLAENRINVKAAMSS